MIKTNRSVWKFFFLTLITCGIYAIVYFCKISTDLNIIATKHDNKNTMFYLLVLLLNCVTFGIADLVWFHKMSKRVGAELSRRNINYSFGAGTYWGWFILGCLIAFGPFVYIHKLSTAMNLLSEDYLRA